MNGMIFKHILRYIFSLCDEEHKNEALNLLEEYIEWCNYSEFRFKKDYGQFKKVFQEIQVELLLNNMHSCKQIISDELIYIDLRSDEEDIS